MTRSYFLKGFLVLWLISLWAPVAMALEKEAVERIKKATFEVVMKKLEKDSLTYEAPLPLDLIPYAIRTDKYFSIGTAFATGPNTFVTAAHVLGLHERTQLEGPFLRDQEGNVYTVDKIQKYSFSRDFVVFSLKEPPQDSTTLELNLDPSINESVFAVGNALGEGVIIRDGLYTSKTPEERDGAWHWIRFSAAASPGNSGGPLVDKEGRVIGVILRKSENENLNYALPISEVENAKAVAEVDTPLMYVIDNTDFTELDYLKQEFSLPKSYSKLRQELVDAFEHFSSDLAKKMWSKHRHETFPEGEGSVPLLHVTQTAVFPRVIARGADGIWNTYYSNDIKHSDIGHNGHVWHGKMGNTWFIRMVKPEDIELARLYHDPKLFLDTLLKGFPMQRTVASKDIRITSMGKPEKDYVHVDGYGRKWQVRIWANEYDDSKLITFSLPVPGGYATQLKWAYTSNETGEVDDLKMLSDFAYQSYYGSLSDWKEFLEQKDLLPEVFARFQLEMDYEKKLSFRSKRFSFAYTPEAMSITPNSDLSLRFTYFKEGDKTVWDIGQMVVGANKNTGDFFEITRKIRPAASLQDAFQSDWEKMRERQLPYNKVAYYDKKRTIITTVHSEGLPEDPNVVYAVAHGLDGNHKQEQLETNLERFLKGLTVHEYGL